MFNKREVIVIVLILVAAIFAMGHSFADDVNQVANESNSSEIVPDILELDLDKTEYGPNVPIVGNLKLYLKKDLFDNPLTEINVKIPGNTQTKTLNELLDNLSKNYMLISGRLNGSNPESKKTITFSGHDKKYIGVKIPRYADVKKVNMVVGGESSNGVKLPRIDIGDDGEDEWYYLGNFENYLPSYILPEGLNDELGGNGVYVTDNTTYFCQKINLPFSKNFNISANYKKLGTAGDLKATIFSPGMGYDFEYPEGGSENCDLPEDSEFGYKGCEIAMSFATKGEYLVCIFNSAEDVLEENEYQIKSGPGKVDITAYKCQGENQYYTCDDLSQADFYIKVQPGAYSEVLDEKVSFGDYELGINSVDNAFRKYVGSADSADPALINFASSVCKEENCLVPLAINVSSSGKITFEDLEAVYVFEDITQPTSTFYDVEELAPLIDSIEGNDLTEGYFLDVPLSLFNLTVPSPPSNLAYAEIYLLAGINGVYLDQQKIIIYESGVVPGSLEDLINETKNWQLLFSDAEFQDIFSLIGLNAEISQFQSEFASIESEFLNSGESDDLINRLNTARENLPKSIKKTGSVTDILYIEPQDVTNDIASVNEQEEVYFLQNKVKVEATIASYTIESFSGVKTDYKVVTKDIIAKESLSKFDVYEVIPKSIIMDLDAVTFERTPEVVNSDPVVKWFVASLRNGEKKTYRYVFESDLMVYPDDIKTIIVETESLKIPGPICGDGLCEAGEDNCPEDCKEKSEFPWLIIIIIILVLAAGGLLYFYKDKIFKKKMPFPNRKNLDNLIGYIKKSKKKGKNDLQIAKILLGKGWKKIQVDYAFKELNANKSSLKNYIQISQKKGLTKEQIRQKLLSKGWDKKAIDKELE
ncbi:MAG: hypothetical protein U9Q69_00730 [Nanoarchaeota archaeon]|nr:hypothetical protein [Nanoarchaeota archaeon]